MNILDQLGWFGNQDTKTSQEPKLWKNWKIGNFNKIPKRGHYSGIRAWYWHLIWSDIYEYKNSGTTIIYWNPKVLLLKRKKNVEEEDNILETMTRNEKRTSYDGEEIIKTMEPIFEYMNNNIMKGFEFLAIQSWEKYIDFKNTKEKMH